MKLECTDTRLRGYSSILIAFSDIIHSSYIHSSSRVSERKTSNIRIILRDLEIYRKEVFMRGKCRQVSKNKRKQNNNRSEEEVPELPSGAETSTVTSHLLTTNEITLSNTLHITTTKGTAL